jgi:hypothetical protein
VTSYKVNDKGRDKLRSLPAKSLENFGDYLAKYSIHPYIAEQLMDPMLEYAFYANSVKDHMEGTFPHPPGLVVDPRNLLSSLEFPLPPGPTNFLGCSEVRVMWMDMDGIVWPREKGGRSQVTVIVGDSNG